MFATWNNLMATINWMNRLASTAYFTIISSIILKGLLSGSFCPGGFCLGAFCRGFWPVTEPTWLYPEVHLWNSVLDEIKSSLSMPSFKNSIYNRLGMLYIDKSICYFFLWTIPSSLFPIFFLSVNVHTLYIIVAGKIRLFSYILS